MKRKSPKKLIAETKIGAANHLFEHEVHCSLSLCSCVVFPSLVQKGVP